MAVFYLIHLINTLRLWSSNGEALKNNWLNRLFLKGRPRCILIGHEYEVSGAKVLEDGRILSYSDDDTLRLWSSNGRPLSVLEGHTGEVIGVKILKDSRILSYSSDDTLRLWSSNGKPLSVLEGHTCSVIGAKVFRR